nr:MAG TPA: hypothetical protein [Caudoviricetes sp.]
MNNDMMTDVCSINGEDVSINFYTSLDAYRKAQFVASVSDMLVGDNYNYVIKDLAFDFCIIALFTDIDTSDVQNADNGITAMEEFVDAYSLVVDIVVENAEDGLIDELSRAVDLNVEYRTGIHIDPISSSLANLIDNLDRKFSEFDLNSMIDIAKSMSDISGELTAEKMLDAYAKTDIFKKNWETAATDKTKKNVNGTTILSPSFEA